MFGCGVSNILNFMKWAFVCLVCREYEYDLLPDSYLHHNNLWPAVAPRKLTKQLHFWSLSIDFGEKIGVF